MLTWEKYCDECKKWGMLNPYPDEAAFSLAYGIAETTEPLVIVPKRDAGKVSERFENHVEPPKEWKKAKPSAIKKEPRPRPIKKIAQPKKIKPERTKKEPEPKKPKTEAKPKIAKPPKPRKTKEEIRAYKRNWMQEYRKKNPKAAYQSVKAWRERNEKNMEKHRESNRQYMRRKRAALKASGNGTTTTKPCAL